MSMSIKNKEITTESFKREYYGEKEDAYSLCKLMNYHNIDTKEVLYCA
jgi:hypothetical protein